MWVLGEKKQTAVHPSAFVEKTARCVWLMYMLTCSQRLRCSHSENERWCFQLQQWIWNKKAGFYISVLATDVKKESGQTQTTKVSAVSQSHVCSSWCTNLKRSPSGGTSTHVLVSQSHVSLTSPWNMEFMATMVSHSVSLQPYTWSETKKCHREVWSWLLTRHLATGVAASIRIRFVKTALSCQRFWWNKQSWIPDQPPF